MREKSRIKRILKLIEQHWNLSQDQRFGQLMVNLGVVEHSNKVWQRDDWDLERDLIKDLKEKNGI